MLVAEADRRRIAEGYDHQSFARELGVSLTLWSLTRRGVKPLRRKLAKAIVRRYKDLKPLAMAEGAQQLLGE